MHKALSLTLIGLLAAIGSAAPVCVVSDARDQVVFSHDGPEDVLRPKDGGIVYLPPRRSRSVDLDARMRDLIAREMTIEYNGSEYEQGLADDLCLGRRLGETLEETVTVSTTHSVEIGMSIEVSSKPFGMGVAFTTSVGYGFSSTSETSTALNYGFELEKGDSGYIGMVNAQISSRVRFRSCKCYDQACVNQCRNGQWQSDQTLHHQKVIMKNGTPRGYVAFVYTN
ncbi:hypothetical protein BGZ74_009681 [Mortierella antarctica]|nr:hypothetical protein BGZ74_009681 [Mortierella antarctica]